MSLTKTEKEIIESLATYKGMRSLKIAEFKELKEEDINPPRKLTAFGYTPGKLTKKVSMRAIDEDGNDILVSGERSIDITKYEGVVGGEKIPVILFEEPEIYELRVYPPPYNWDELLFHRFAQKEQVQYYLSHILASAHILEKGWLNFAWVRQGAQTIPKLNATGPLAGSQLMYRDMGNGETTIIIKNIMGLGLVANTINRISGLNTTYFRYKPEGKEEEGTIDNAERERLIEAVKWVNDNWDDTKKYAKLPFLSQIEANQ